MGKVEPELMLSGTTCGVSGLIMVFPGQIDDNDQANASLFTGSTRLHPNLPTNQITQVKLTLTPTIKEIPRTLLPG